MIRICHRRSTPRCAAWQRLLEDHYYWAGLVQMRWVEDHNWAIYKQELAAELEPSPEVEQFFQEIRDYLVAEFTGHAVGKMTVEEVRARGPTGFGRARYLARRQAVLHG